MHACVIGRTSSHAIITLPRAHTHTHTHKRVDPLWYCFRGAKSSGALWACGCLRVSLAANRVARSQIGPLISKIISCHSVVYGLTNCIRPGEPRQLLSSSAQPQERWNLYASMIYFCEHAHRWNMAFVLLYFRCKLCVTLHLPRNYIYTWAIVSVLKLILRNRCDLSFNAVPRRAVIVCDDRWMRVVCDLCGGIDRLISSWNARRQKLACENHNLAKIIIRNAVCKCQNATLGEQCKIIPIRRNL